jgi:signal transduction histidine kinase/ligand-binding sensor domain-containing protein
VLSLLYSPEDDVLWIGHQSGLGLFKPPPAPSYSTVAAAAEPVEDRSILRAAAQPLAKQNGPARLPHAPREAMFFETFQSSGRPFVTALLRSQSGVIRVIAAGSLFEFSAGRFVRVEDPRLHFDLAYAAEDREGNLWLVKRAAGILRVARHGFITFRESDGLGQAIGSVFEDRAGGLIAISQDWRVSRFDGERFHTIRANVPARPRAAGWAANLKAIEDHRGEWWFATGAGLVRFSGIRRIEDLATTVPTTYTARDGLAQDSINRLFEDSRGDIWIASLIPGREVLTRWDRASGHFQRYSDVDGLQAFNAPTSFYEDARHILFITLRDGGIARYDGRSFRVLSRADGVPAGNIGGAIGDRAGKLWCWSSPGVFRIDDLSAARLQPIIVAPTKQMRSGSVGALVEDAHGSLYIAGGAGVARIDNAASAVGSANARIVALYTISDGLAGNEVSGAYADRLGRLWFSTTQGLSYYEPETRERSLAPRIRIGGVRVAGIEQSVSPGGADRLAGLELTPGRSQLEIAFFGIDFAPGGTLSFEYRLSGASDDAWSVPSASRSVMFSNLAPGSYEFEVRAVSAAGERSPEPARVVFRVLPPVWRRWWFITLASSVVVGSVAAFEHYRAANRREISRAREERLAALEQVRRRIAADLHDEIGSTLTQISILSEVALQQGTRATPERSHALSTIAASSRELVDAMSDIVWAINPAKDHLADLTQRMRRMAADAFTATNITFRLGLPPADQEIALGAHLRREVFLIFKEAVNNIVKHSACSEVAITLDIDGAVLRLELHDNGRGFDPLAPSEGHGLASLRNRAAAIGGSLAVVSARGAGTAITLHLPMTT